jgi:short-subunit dehydrogenase
METNLKGVFLCAREVIPVMIRQGTGHIINVASQAGKFGFPNLAIYCASKFGVVGFSESLQQELIPYNIKVSCLCPGYVDTRLLKIFPEEILKKARVVTTEDVADQLLEVIIASDMVVASKERGKRFMPLEKIKKIIRRIAALWTTSGLV